MVKKSILAKVGDKINYKLIRDGYKTGKGNVVVTAEMDTKTTIVADVPSTAYTSNLDYEVDISGENPPIINIKNDITCPDDTVISKGKYFYYNSLGSEDYKFSKEKADEIGIFNDNDSKYYDINSNLSFTNLSHKNGIISGFSRSNYATFSVSSYEVGGGFVIYFRTGSDNAQQGQIFYTGLETGLLIDTNFTCGRFGFTPTTVAQPNTNYYCKMTYQSSGKGLYQIYNENNELLCTGNGIDASSSYSISLGSLYQYYSQAFKGSIDLIKSYIFKADGTKTYFCDYGYNVQGIKDLKLQDTGAELTTKLFDYHCSVLQYNTKTVGSITLNNGIASNFSNSNYLKLEGCYTTDLIYVVKFTTGSNVSNNQYISMLDVWFDLYIDQNYLRCYNWSSNSIYDLMQVSTNTTYYVKITINPVNKTKTYELSTDGVTYTLLKTFTDTSIEVPSANLLAVGCHSVSFTSPFNGTVDLLNSYIENNANKIYLAFYGDKTSLYINTEKDNNLYYEKDELQLNVSKVGSAVVVDEGGIASNFSASNYLDLGNFDFSGDYEIVLKFKMPETDSDTANYKPFFDAKSNLYFNIATTNHINGKRYIHTNSGNGSSWNADIIGITPLELNTEYYVKVVRSGTIRTTYLSTDNTTWSTEGTIEDTNDYSLGYCLGAASHLSSQEIFKGSFDLTKCYIQIGTNEKKYFAEKVTKRYNIPSLYSEFIDNITIPAHALYEYVNGEWKLSGDSPVITQDITVNADNAEIAMKEIIE